MKIPLVHRSRLTVEALEPRDVPSALSVSDVAVREGPTATGVLDPTGAAAIGLSQFRNLTFDTNPADVHYRLARLLYERHDPTARKHLLQALEDAPRFKDALNLLKRMNEERRTQVEPAGQQPHAALTGLSAITASAE